MGVIPPPLGEDDPLEIGSYLMQQLRSEGILPPISSAIGHMVTRPSAEEPLRLMSPGPLATNTEETPAPTPSASLYSSAVAGAQMTLSQGVSQNLAMGGRWPFNGEYESDVDPDDEEDDNTVFHLLPVILSLN